MHSNCSDSNSIYFLRMSWKERITTTKMSSALFGLSTPAPEEVCARHCLTLKFNMAFNLIINIVVIRNLTFIEY